MTTIDAASAPAAAGAVRFLGREAAYWRLRLRGAVLVAVTLGLYRFWFATDVRRFMWSNTEIGGETLEYCGLATELLGGFLLAVAIVAPLYTALAGAALAFDAEEEATALASFVLVMLLGQIALYRARRYRLTRTVFRGVRFDQHGAAWRYALLALSWWTGAIVTLGLLYPFAQASLQRFKMRHTSYGDLPGGFAASGAALFLRGLPIWLLVVGPLLMAFFALGGMADWNALSGAAGAAGTAPAPAPLDARVVRTLATALGLSVGAALLLYPLFQAIVMRWWISGLRFGTVSVVSRLPTGKVYRIYLRFVLYLLAFLVAVILFGGAAAVAGGALLGPQHSALAELALSALTLVFYVVAALGVSTIYQVVVSFALWRLGAQTAELTGAAALAAVRASGTASSALGEGLVDALGVGGI